MVKRNLKEVVQAVGEEVHQEEEVVVHLVVEVTKVVVAVVCLKCQVCQEDCQRCPNQELVVAHNLNPSHCHQVIQVCWLNHSSHHQ